LTPAVGDYVTTINTAM